MFYEELFILIILICIVFKLSGLNSIHFNVIIILKMNFWITVLYFWMETFSLIF